MPILRFSALAFFLVLSDVQAGSAATLVWYRNAASESIYLVAGAPVNFAPAFAEFEKRDEIGRIQTVPEAGTRPFRCFRRPPPQASAFCTASPMEMKLIGRAGFVLAFEAGHMWQFRVPGTIPLFRLSAVAATNGARQYRLVTERTELRRLRAQGWVLDGVKGYVYPAGARER